MKRRIAAYLVVAASLATSLLAQTPYVLDVPQASLDRVLTAYGMTLVEPLNTEGGAYLVTAPGTQPSSALIAQVTADPSVTDFEADAAIEEVEADPKSKVQPDLSALQALIAGAVPQVYLGVTVPSFYAGQPTAAAIHLPQVQQAVLGGAPIVAVIDTGIDPDHPALAKSIVSGYDFTRNIAGIPSELDDLNREESGALLYSSSVALTSKTQPLQLTQSTVVILDPATIALLSGTGQTLGYFGHGTMTAGLIHLVAPTALIMPLKAFNSDGSSDLANVVRAIYFAADNGANVISMSFSSETASPQLQAAMGYARSKGLICVAAGGNDGEQEMVYPAGFEEILGIGSINASNGRSSFSNYGVDSVKMAAPGEALLTTYPGNNYAGVWGTSFSSALVAGSAALLLQASPGSGSDSIRSALQNGSPLASSLGLGESRLDLLPALSSLSGDN